MVEYISSWKNFAGGVFEMQVERSESNYQMKVNADKDCLLMLMDTLTNNAKRHGFEGIWKPENIVNISLQHVKYNDKACLLVSMSNNGHPLKEGFTIYDYITRGRFDGDSGHTGLGGNHVYTIMKRHGGWLNLRNDKSWNFIIDMIFPIQGSLMVDFNDYEYEAI